MLRRLELIDEEVSQYGSLLVKCDDHLMAKKFGHRTTPALVFFRHGKVLHFEGFPQKPPQPLSLSRSTPLGVQQSRYHHFFVCYH